MREIEYATDTSHGHMIRGHAPANSIQLECIAVAVGYCSLKRARACARFPWVMHPGNVVSGGKHSPMADPLQRRPNRLLGECVRIEEIKSIQQVQLCIPRPTQPALYGGCGGAHRGRQRSYDPRCSLQDSTFSPHDMQTERVWRTQHDTEGCLV